MVPLVTAGTITVLAVVLVLLCQVGRGFWLAGDTCWPIRSVRAAWGGCGAVTTSCWIVR